MDIHKYGQFFILSMSLLWSDAWASPFDGHITVWDETTGGVVENITITGDVDLANNFLSIDPVMVDGSLMTFTSITIHNPGPSKIFSSMDSAVIQAGQTGARYNINWKGSSTVVLNVFSSFEAANGIIYFPNVLNGATVPGGLINSTHRLSVYILGISSLGTVGVEVADGNIHDCLSIGGDNITLNASYELIGNATSVTVDWSVDGVYVGTGESITTFMELGAHLVTAEIIPNTGSPKTATGDVTILDRHAPTVTATFKLNGVPVTQIDAATMGDVEVVIEATDACDPSPVPSPNITLTQVHMIDNNGVIPIQASGDRVELATTAIRMEGSATDASGRTAFASAVLDILY